MNKEIYLSVSNSILYKRCRRKWDFASSLRMNLEPKETFSADAWFGTGIHFALEDFHGYNYFKDPSLAFQAYYKCFDRKTELDMNCEALADIAPGILDYYVKEWLPKRKQFSTLFINGVPQVEVNIKLRLPKLSELLGADIFVIMKIDRMVVDDLGRIYALDNKTVKKFDMDKLETDQQISWYSWGAELYYNRPVEGMIYLQFKKKLVNDPKILKNESISYDKEQGTNYYRYYEMLKFKYGSPENAPDNNQQCLEYLRSRESDMGDDFIRYDIVRRSAANKKNIYNTILSETTEMLNPDLPIYANPTRDCFNDCLFRSVCLAIDDNLDYQFILDNNFQSRINERDKWRSKLPKDYLEFIKKGDKIK